MTVVAILPPPPNPWIARPATSMSMLLDPAQIPEPRKKKARKMSIVGLRPKMDAKPPTVGRTAVEAMV
jgi:hypothetical protein